MSHWEAAQTHLNETTPVRSAHRFDEGALLDYLERDVEGFQGPVEIRQFKGGQSSPTFHLAAASGEYVMRKKPPGKLLPSAHAVDREYRVMRALENTPVPVCRTHALCLDESLIGTMFYVMDYVPGRIFRDPTLPGMTPAQRREIYLAMIEVLAALHQVDHEKAGLADFGKTGSYYARQISRWSRQYEAQKTTGIPSMERLMEWLPDNIPATEETTLVHGDYRLENLILHPTEPRVAAVLDWELSTLGHPLADLVYNCMPYHLPPGPFGGLAHKQTDHSGIPGEAEHVNVYCRLTGRDKIPDWDFCMAFALFRSASIAQGVYARALQGNASNENAIRVGEGAALLADLAWKVAQAS
ncbi:MAG: phosphotransferase [bacterium]|nr:phosphotransferase [bacterium]